MANSKIISHSTRKNRKPKKILTNELSEMEKIIESKESEMIALNEEMSEQTQRVNMLISENEKLKTENEELNKNAQDISNLVEASEQLKEAREKLSMNEEELDRLGGKIEQLRRENHNLEDNIKELKSEIEKEKKDSKDVLAQLRVEIKKLKKEKAIYLEKLEQYDKSEDITEKKLPVSKQTFKIQIYERQGQYHGRIENVLFPENGIPFTGLDSKKILAFISEYLQAIEEEPVTIPKSAVSFKEISLSQRQCSINPDQIFSSHDPIEFDAILELVPTPLDDFDKLNRYMAFRAVVKKGNEVLIDKSTAIELKKGVKDYRGKILVPPLCPNTYSLSLFAQIPYRRQIVESGPEKILVK